jgi:HAD superfamily hydrolase (TIGR01509 family)
MVRGKAVIKAVVFDMDGVLIDAKEWHYDALNRALALFGFEISRSEHLQGFDGLPTSKKLEMLSEDRGLPIGLHRFVNEMKQAYTLEMIHTTCKPLFVHQYALGRLHDAGYKTAVASNSIRDSVELMMAKARLEQHLDIQLSTNDVSAPKPDPEIYLAAMDQLGVQSHECLVVEDNEHGVQAAKASGAHVLVVSTVYDVNYENIMRRINEIEGGA